MGQGRRQPRHPVPAQIHGKNTQTSQRRQNRNVSRGTKPVGMQKQHVQFPLSRAHLDGRNVSGLDRDQKAPHKDSPKEGKKSSSFLKKRTKKLLLF
jgi:hypothetical protein